MTAPDDPPRRRRAEPSAKPWRPLDGGEDDRPRLAAYARAAGTSPSTPGVRQALDRGIPPAALRRATVLGAHATQVVRLWDADGPDGDGIRTLVVAARSVGADVRSVSDVTTREAAYPDGDARRSVDLVRHFLGHVLVVRDTTVAEALMWAYAGMARQGSGIGAAIDAWHATVGPDAPWYAAAGYDMPTSAALVRDDPVDRDDLAVLASLMR